MNILNETRIQHVLNVDIPQWRDRGTHYTCWLLNLIQKADPNNRHKLKEIYPNEVEAYTRWERIELAEAMMPQIGEVMACGKPFGDVATGMLGVVYERYDRQGRRKCRDGMEHLPTDREKFDNNADDNVGVSIIWETGFYDGFSRSDLNLLNVKHTGRLDEFVRYYSFSNVNELTQDFNRGWFDRALGKRPSPEPSEPRWNVSLTEEDFQKLVSGGEVIKRKSAAPETHIILQDIGFDRMLAAVDKAMEP